MKTKNITIKTPKTKLWCVTQGNYGSRWEDVSQDDNYKDAKQCLKDYNTNETMYAHRLIKRRVKL